jgi:hypothetical protein
VEGEVFSFLLTVAKSERPCFFSSAVTGRDLGSDVCLLSTPLLHQQLSPSFFFSFGSFWAAAMWLVWCDPGGEATVGSVCFLLVCSVQPSSSESSYTG